MGKEEFVLGLAIGDPEVLKAAQFVKTSVGITAFFLVIELVHVLEQRGFTGMSQSEIFVWAVDTVREVVIIISGYLGVKLSSRICLGCFCGMSILSSGIAVVSTLKDLKQAAPVGLVVLRFFASVFFAMGGYFSWKLFERAKDGALIGGDGSQATDKQAYSLLGLHMMDLQVLKATQSVLTSLGIIVCLLGSFVIIGAEGALLHSHFLSLWVFCVLVVLSMSYTAIAGIMRSSKPLLSCFCAISGTLCGFFGLGTLMTMLSCGSRCLTIIVFDLFVVGVFGMALQNAMILKTKVVQGVPLTATIQVQEEKEETGPVPAELVGVGAKDEPPPPKDGTEQL